MSKGDAMLPQGVYAEKYTSQSTNETSAIDKHDDKSTTGWKVYSDYKVEVPARYELSKLIGKGAFGIVFSAQLGHKDGTKERVAVKKIAIRNDNVLEVKRLVRELYLLRHFNHPNIVGLKDVIEPACPEKFEDLYLATDLMDIDLNHVINSKQSLSEHHVGYFILYLLNGLRAIHSAGVLHRDLKPSNIVVNADCSLKICDFGLAREVSDDPMTEYVATRWYRAPELLMQSSQYGGSVDIWSVGCIFAELLQRKAIFKGNNHLHQLSVIMDLIGSPSDEDIEGIGSEKARAYIRNLPKKEKRDLHKAFPNASRLALDLLSKMLVYDPRKRWTVDECLAHEYFKSHEEPLKTQSTPFSWEQHGIDISDENLTLFELKKILFNLIVDFHPEYAKFKWWSDEELQSHEAEKQKHAKTT